MPVVTPAIKQLKDLQIETEVRVMSAHRTPKEIFGIKCNLLLYCVVIKVKGPFEKGGDIMSEKNSLVLTEDSFIFNTREISEMLISS